VDEPEIEQKSMAVLLKQEELHEKKSNSVLLEAFLKTHHRRIGQITFITIDAIQFSLQFTRIRYWKRLRLRPLSLVITVVGNFWSQKILSFALKKSMSRRLSKLNASLK
jgi:hypothetical protein